MGIARCSDDGGMLGGGAVRVGSLGDEDDFHRATGGGMSEPNLQLADLLAVLSHEHEVRGSGNC